MRRECRWHCGLSGGSLGQYTKNQAHTTQDTSQNHPSPTRTIDTIFSSVIAPHHNHPNSRASQRGHKTPSMVNRYHIWRNGHTHTPPFPRPHSPSSSILGSAAIVWEKPGEKCTLPPFKQNVSSVPVLPRWIFFFTCGWLQPWLVGRFALRGQHTTPTIPLRAAIHVRSDPIVFCFVLTALSGIGLPTSEQE